MGTLGPWLAIVFVTTAVVDAGHSSRVLQVNCKGDIFTSTDGHLDCQRHRATPIQWTTADACQCLPPRTTFRMDTQQCVDKLHECVQVSFDGAIVPGDSIPLVSTLSHGQLVHSGAHLALNKVIHFEQFVCRVSEEKMLIVDGWLPLANITNAQPFNFQLVQMANRQIGLQFVGDAEDNRKLEGKLIRVGLSCVTAERSNIVPQPCIAFRVTATSQSDTRWSSKEDDGQLSLVGGAAAVGGPSKWVILSLGAGLLGVTYVLAILVYVVVRKNVSDNTKQSNGRLSWMTSVCVNRKKTPTALSVEVNKEPMDNGPGSPQSHPRANVTVVSVGGQSHRPIQRSKSDVGHLKCDQQPHGHRRQSMAKRSESMMTAKSVSFDPNDVIIGAGRLTTLASLGHSDVQQQPSHPGASILKRSEEEQQQLPSRFLLDSFNRKQEWRSRRRVANGPDDSGYHSSDSERLNADKSISFNQNV